MDSLTAAALLGVIATVVAILVGLSNLVAFFQTQGEKRRAKRQQQPARPNPPAAAESLAPVAPASAAPAPAALPANLQANLPAEATPLIGREQEVAAVAALLLRGEVRLVTLVGPPGAGKTRLGVKVAGTLAGEFAGGVCFVALAALRDAALVAPTIAHALGVQEVAGRPWVETLKRELRDEQMLLVLDNFEQVIPAATLVTALLAEAPRLEILVTSREALHVSGEHEFAVPPLALPDPQAHSSLDQVAQSAAVTLFVQRTQAVQPHFRLTQANAAAVAELCTLLDGLPLAIELAAARTKLFSPQEMLARLASRFEWLTSGPRDLPAHQQTLQSTLDWSYNLLEAEEQALLRRLGVFVGGCTLAAIESVCCSAGDPPVELWENMASLVDKNLLQRAVSSEAGSEEEARFVMLETIREYAHALLLASEEADAVRDRHLDFFVRLAESAKSHSYGVGPDWLARLELEHDNLRAAFQWALTKEDAGAMARLAMALAAFWDLRGHVREGKRWLETVLARRSQLPANQQAFLLTNYGGLLSLCGDYARAAQIHAEAAALWRELDDIGGLAWALCQWGEIAQHQEEYAQAEALWKQGLALYRESGDGNIPIAWALFGLGNVARLQGDIQTAAQLFAESLELQRAVDARAEIAWTLVRSGQVAQAQGKIEQATVFVQEGLQLHNEMGNRQGVAEGLAALGSIALSRRRAAPAVQLFGAADKLLLTIGLQMDPKDQSDYEHNLASARAKLGDKAFRAAWAKGQSMNVEEAQAFAAQASQ